MTMLKSRFGRVPVDLTEVQVTASLCRKSFYDFVKEFWPIIIREKPVWNWHIKFLCDELQTVAERVFRGLPKAYDLIINISPGSTKSTIATVMFPAWCWTRMASAKIITASFSHDLASDLSRKARDIIKSDKYKACFPGVQIREDQDSKGFYVNTRGGERYAFGVGGAVTGRHGHFIIVDDPLDPNRAVSELELRTANRWMEETLPSRKVDKTVTPTILIMQRLHENDPTGARLEKAKKIPVKHVCLPAELTDNVKPESCRDFYVNGLMDPVRLSWEALAEAEAQGDYPYASQYLQTPIPRGGAMFDVSKIRIENPPPMTIVREVRFWDKAGTQGAGHYTCGVRMGVDVYGRYWVMSVVRGRWDSHLREHTMRMTAISDTRKVRIGVEQEPGSGGKESAQGTVRNLAGFLVQAVKLGKSDGDKEARADPFSYQVNSGNVFLVPGPWNTEYLAELSFFPMSKHKDQVDASSGAFNLLAGKRRVLGGSKVMKQYIEGRSSSEIEKMAK